jgi:hypothetical protein
MKPALSAAALAAAAALYAAPATGQAQQPGQRINRLVVYGSDRCPRASGNDITICARRGENERYRIPEALRDEATSPDPENTSWAARAESLEYVGRTGTQSCSTVGPGGFTGCWAELLRAARGDRRTEGQPGR